MKLTQEQKRIKIAKEQGFSVLFNEEKKLFELLNPEGKWTYPYDADGESEEHCWSYCPDYFNDLNACHEMEASFKSAGELGRYHHLLCEMAEKKWWNSSIGYDHQRACRSMAISSLASQRAEAFGLTLNLWTTEQ